MHDPKRTNWQRFCGGVGAAALVAACGGPSAPPPRIQPILPSQPTASPAPSAPVGPSGPSAAELELQELAKPRGHLSTSKIREVVRANYNRMVPCYERGVARDPSLAGRVRVQVIVRNDGSVFSAKDAEGLATTSTTVVVESQEPPLRDPQVVACVVDAFRALRFPAPSGGNAVFVYPVTFSMQ